MLSNNLNTILLNTNVTEWEWYHIYHFIMTLNNNHFIKYSKSLHHRLNSENINGSKLDTLTENDWFKLGIDDANDVNILINSFETLLTNNKNKTKNNNDANNNENRSTNSNTNTNTSNTNNNSEIGTNNINNINTNTIITNNNNNNMYMINGDLINNIHGALYQNELQKHQLTNNCQILYLYAQQIINQLQNERNQRIIAENALNQITNQSNTQQQILNDALIKCYNQQSFLAINYAQLQNVYSKSENELQITHGKLQDMEEKYLRTNEEYNNKCDEICEYKKLKSEHTELQMKYNEMNFKLQSKCTEYQMLLDKYNKSRLQQTETDREIETETETNGFKHWDFNDVYLWIINMDNGYFEKYESLYESLEILNICGESLIEFDVDEINNIGISDVMDQRRFLANIRILIKNCGDSTISDDNSLYDFANIDLFGN